VAGIRHETGTEQVWDSVLDDIPGGDEGGTRDDDVVSG